MNIRMDHGLRMITGPRGLVSVAALALGLTALLLHHSLQAQTMNLALQKSYTLTPAPNYALSRDSGDSVQLTDGKRYGSDWTKKSSVAWRVYDAIPEVTIDLGKAYAIGEVKVHTVGSGAGHVREPDFVLVLVSDDGIRYTCAGVAAAHGPGRGTTPRSRIPTTISVKGLNIQGRYVRVVLQPGSVYVVLDEIEVLSADGDIATASMQSKALPSRGREDFELAERNIQFKREVRALEGALARNRGQIASAEQQKMESDLRRLASGVDSDRLRSVAELDPLGEGLGTIRAALYQAIYRKPLVLLQGAPLKNRPVGDVLDRGEETTGLAMKLWRNECAVSAVNLINAGSDPLSIVASISPLTGEDYGSRELFKLRRAANVVARGLGVIDDALPLQSVTPFTLKPGGVTQLWIEFNSEELPAGHYTGSLALAISTTGRSDPNMQMIPVNITVEPPMLPGSLDINVCNWAYPMRSAVTREVSMEAAADLKVHYTNVFVIPAADLTLPRTVSAAAGIESEALARMDTLMQENSYAKTYLFFMAFRPGRKDSGAFGIWMTEPWKQTFAQWLRRFTDHLKMRGIDYDRFAMYPFDETLGDEFYELAKLIKAINPKVRIYANSFGTGPGDFMRFADLVDIWCFSLPQCQAHCGWLDMVKDLGNEVWLYDARGPGKANDPYSYYRLLPWWVFSYGLTGAGFWTYVDPTDNVSWDDTGTAVGYYGVVYGRAGSPLNAGGESIVPSRRWEAWRMGVEDYACLKQTEAAVAALGPAEASRYRGLIQQQVKTVLADPDNTRAADLARHALTRIILEANDRMAALNP